MTSAILPLEQDVLAAQAGDREAFTRLVDASKSVVCAISLAIVRDVSLSEDVAQNVFLAAWNGLGKLRSASSFLPWLRQLARNQAKEAMRGRTRFNRRQMSWPELDALGVPDTAADPAAALIHREEEEALAEAIELLPDEAREVVTLYYREGKSTRQVAALLGLSEDAIKKRLERARAALKGTVLERFAASVGRTAPGAAFTATVIASLVWSPRDAAAATGALAKKIGGVAPIAKGGLGGTIAAIVSGLIAIIAVAGWLRFKAPSDGGPLTNRTASGGSLVSQRESASSDTAAAFANEPSRYPRALRDRARRDELRGRILATLADTQEHPTAAPPMGRGQRETNDVEEFGRFVTQAIREDFVPMARDCAKQLAIRRPGAHGTAVVAFELLGDSRIGGVVNSAEIDRSQSTLIDAEFETCISESLYGVYFDPPPGGGRATLNFPVRVIEGAEGAIDEEVQDFHIRDKR